MPLHPSHIYGDPQRLFLNTELGCRSACKYCYLPTEGFVIGDVPPEHLRVSPSMLTDYLKKDARFQPGRDGSVLSIGCFSECWDPRNRAATAELLAHLLPLGNPVQMATKRLVRRRELEGAASSAIWRNQLSIYVSSATLSMWAQYEPGTAAPGVRFRTFETCEALGIPAFLYIKPVIPNVTIRDSEGFAELMRVHRIAAVVGELFETGAQGKISPISRHLAIAPHPDVLKLRSFLADYGKVYGVSTDVLSDLRELCI
jgi:DNA repair photolyase